MSGYSLAHNDLKTFLDFTNISPGILHTYYKVCDS